MLTLQDGLRRAVPAVVLVLGLGAGCTGERPSLGEEQEPTTASTESTTTTTVTPAAEVAQASAEVIAVFPSATAEEPAQEISAGDVTSAPGVPIVFLVKDRDDDEDRIEVYLPVQPIGSTGWVQAEDVSLSSVPYRIEVALTDRRLRVYDEGEVVFNEPVSVGDTTGLTPGEVYFVKELLQPADPDGPYGAFAYGLSGFSNVLTSSDEEGGVVGIHGTDDPSVIDTTEAGGSIGLANDDIGRLVEDIGLPLGTPVDILE